MPFLIIIIELHLKLVNFQSAMGPSYRKQMLNAECCTAGIMHSSSFALISSNLHLCENSGADWVFTGSCIRAAQRNSQCFQGHEESPYTLICAEVKALE